MVDEIIQVRIRHVAGVRCQLHLAGKQAGLGAQLSGFFHQPFCQTAGRSFQLCAVGKTGVDLLHQGRSLLRILVHRTGQHAAAPGQHSQRQCRRLKQTNDLKLVVIDYLQLMTSGKAVESRQQEVSEFSRALKLLAKELEVPVVALSQLNRGPEMRNDKKPQLSDLRESGSIEQDADVVFLVHRPDFYDKEDRPGEADIIMAKHRNGPTETFHLAFLGATSKFKDMPQDYNANQGV